jgi:F0F1-type ATP synthase alpha subunit
LWEETLRIDAEHQKYLEDCQRKAEEEKRKAVEEIKKINSDIAEVRYGKHNKKPKQQVKLPYAKAGVIVNLKNGKVRKPKKCEVGLTILDPYSDPSLEDGEPVFTKEGKVIKHGRKAKKD